MTEPTIICPNCKTEIPLTESIAAPLVADTRRQYEQRLESERKSIADEEAKKAKRLVATDLERQAQELVDLQEVLKQRDSKLADAQKAQAELIREQRELDDAKREMDLTIEKRVEQSLAKVRENAKQEAEEGLRLKVAEKEQQLAGMQRQIEELRRRADQGSQQL